MTIVNMVGGGDSATVEVIETKNLATTSYGSFGTTSSNSTKVTAPITSAPSVRVLCGKTKDMAFASTLGTDYTTISSSSSTTYVASGADGFLKEGLFTYASDLRTILETVGTVTVEGVFYAPYDIYLTYGATNVTECGKWVGTASLNASGRPVLSDYSVVTQPKTRLLSYKSLDRCVVAITAITALIEN